MCVSSINVKRGENFCKALRALFSRNEEFLTTLRLEMKFEQMKAP